MDYREKMPLIVVDAGHGGYDNGASYNGRLEKNDNLALALLVRDALRVAGFEVVMTRDTDVFVSLADRAALANRVGADLFISLHRNSFTELTAWTNGVSNHIYLLAKEETSKRAATYVLDEIVSVGVQRNAGIKRDDFYVLRNTAMPAMLVEMGYIINELDNILFDTHIVDYSYAITRGVLKYFNLEVKPPAPPIPPPVTPPSPPTFGCNAPIDVIGKQQQVVNERFGLSMLINSKYDLATRNEMTKALQLSLNRDFNAGLVVDGVIGPRTIAAIPTLLQGDRGNVVFVLQTLLMFSTYSPGVIDGIFGMRTQVAVQSFQTDRGLLASGVATSETMIKLLGC